MHTELTHNVEQFLYREARLLDERRFREWLALLTDDLRYWMAGRSNPYPQVSKALVILEPDRYSEADVPRDDELAIFDETKATLVQRIARLETGMAWAEDPPSRTRHLLSNIEVEPGATAAEPRSLPTCWCTGIGRRGNKTATLGRGRTSYGTSTVPGRSRAARSSWISTCSWRRT